MKRSSYSLIYLLVPLVILFGPTAVAILITNSFWPGLLLFIGTLFLMIWLILAGNEQATITGLLYFSIIAVPICFFLGGYIAGWEPFGWWLFIMLPAFLCLFIGSGLNTIRAKKGLRTLLIGIAFSILLMPIIGYYGQVVSLSELIQDQASHLFSLGDVEQTIPAGFSDNPVIENAIENYRPLAERSFWGKSAVIVWLIALTLFFYSTLIFWAGLKSRTWSLLLIISAFIILPLVLPDLSSAIAPHLYAGPVYIVELLISFSVLRWGTAGWGLLLFGSIVSILFIPLRRHLTLLQGLTEFLKSLRREFGTTIVKVFEEKVYEQQSVGMLSFYYLIFGCGITIIIWLALHRMPPAQLPFYFLPDLALPSFWPPFLHWPYLLMGLLWASVATIHERLLKKKFANSNIKVKLSPRFFAIGILLSLFVPAGLLFFLTGDLLTRVGLLIIGVSPIPKTHIKGKQISPGRRDKPKEPAPRPVPKPSPRPAPRPVPRPSPNPVPGQPRTGNLPPRKEQKPVPEKPKPEHVPTQTKPGSAPNKTGPDVKKSDPSTISGEQGSKTVPRTPIPAEQSGMAMRKSELLFKSEETLVDLCPQGDNYFLALEENSNIAVISQSRLVKQHRLQLLSPLGLEYLSEDKVLAIGAREIFTIDIKDNIEVAEEDNVSETISCYALNPYRTMLAYGFGKSGEVHGIFLTGKKIVSYAKKLQGVQKMAFSGDGRFLSLGTESAEVHIIDIATRNIVNTFNPESFDCAGVKQLHSSPMARWIVAYDRNDLFSWDSQGNICFKIKIDGVITAMDVNSEDGRVAYSSSRGILRIISDDSKAELFNGKVAPGKIIKIIWEDSNKLLVMDDDSLYRVRL